MPLRIARIHFRTVGYSFAAWGDKLHVPEAHDPGVVAVMITNRDERRGQKPRLSALRWVRLGHPAALCGRIGHKKERKGERAECYGQRFVTAFHFSSPWQPALRLGTELTSTATLSAMQML
jgi:hypothetical protein